MKSWHEQGGAAFPIPDAEVGSHPFEYGMSLRDWFAGQALASITMRMIEAAHEQGDVSMPEARAGIASAAYRIADAMLAERAK